MCFYSACMTRTRMRVWYHVTLGIEVQIWTSNSYNHATPWGIGYGFLPARQTRYAPIDVTSIPLVDGATRMRLNSLDPWGRIGYGFLPARQTRYTNIDVLLFRLYDALLACGCGITIGYGFLPARQTRYTNIDVLLFRLYDALLACGCGTDSYLLARLGMPPS
ncbi:hypothetical protein BJ742DRAFT_854172, partial [Cladochytrium replicatum]